MSKNKIPSLINGSTAVPKATVAGKECACKGCEGSITKGEKCFDISNPRKAFGNPRRFCPSCFREVLAKTKVDIVELEKQVEA